MHRPSPGKNKGSNNNNSNNKSENVKSKEELYKEELGDGMEKEREREIWKRGREMHVEFVRRGTRLRAFLHSPAANM